MGAGEPDPDGEGRQGRISASGRNILKAHGVWVSEPVPMFPFPGSPLYVQTFGAMPDDDAWERAHHFYTSHVRR